MSKPTKIAQFTRYGDYSNDNSLWRALSPSLPGRQMLSVFSVLLCMIVVMFGCICVAGSAEVRDRNPEKLLHTVVLYSFVFHRKQ